METIFMSTDEDRRVSLFRQKWTGKVAGQYARQGAGAFGVWEAYRNSDRYG